MTSKNLFEAINTHPSVQSAVKDLAQGLKHKITGLSAGAKALFVASIQNLSQHSCLILTATPDEAKGWRENLAAVMGENRVMLLPSLPFLPVDIIDAAQIRQEEAAILAQLCLGQNIVVVSCFTNALNKQTPPEILRKACFHLKAGASYEPAGIAARLVKLGYRREKLVDMPGTFSLRGHILDIFIPTQELPVRAEFFDTEIESLRAFDPANQLSQKKQLPSIIITPAGGLWPGDELAGEMAAALEKEIAETAGRLGRAAADRFLEKFAHLPEALRNKEQLAQNAGFLPYPYAKPAALTDYLGKNGLIVLDEPEKITKAAQEQESARQQNFLQLLDEGHILPSLGDKYFSTNDFYRMFAPRAVLGFSSLPGASGFAFERGQSILCRETPSYAGRLDLFCSDFAGLQKQGYRLFFLTDSPQQAHSMTEMLASRSLKPPENIKSFFNPAFESPDWKLAVITGKSLLGQNKQRSQQLKRALVKKERALDSFIDLQPGDYVVHNYHGIGRYLGIERVTAENITKDYLKIQYAGTDRLFVPVEQMNLVQKYIGNEGAAPKLYKLGGSQWQKVKKKARQSVQDMTDELLALYSARAALPGFAFSPDTPWQREFEEAFPFTPTPDQMQCTKEIKGDMEKSTPMDRLICGDVGYGKTEVAMRAAFKATLDNKQVAVLAPTTLLVEQHLRTFRERMGGFPVRVEALSRFIPTAQQKKLLSSLSTGSIDIIIGTHRLLSADVRFKDLGLLIIDEEQRFGVSHKEKIKQLKKNVDVLSLSATPIPRTLHMSLVGIRDMSVINTPPENRFAVQTYVLEENRHLLSEAIHQELRRGGQIYLIHNKVETIYQTADTIAALAPQARIAVAHGQMRERELEQVMQKFIAGETDILVCTTIAESGLDIPNVNTLIVREADHFGLAQLYQLRGRVGRSGRQAYAYFTFPAQKLLSDIAQKRLKAISDFTELGAGFKIALRDMEIRGAGNLLGREQHGHIAAVGFDMYCRLIEEVLQEKKGELPALEQTDDAPQLDLAFNAYIPDNYIDDTLLKIELYKRIAGIAGLEELGEVRAETQDRYGPLPPAADNLFLLGAIKYLAQICRIAAINQNSAGFRLLLRHDHKIGGPPLLELAKKLYPALTFQNKKDFVLNFKTSTSSSLAKAEELKKLLMLLTSI